MHNRQPKHLLAIILLLILATVAFTACSGDNPAQTGAPEETAPAAEQEQDGTGSQFMPDQSFKLIDANANGTLEEREFNLLLVRVDIANQGQFATYDADDNNRIDTGEFNTFLVDEGLAAVDTPAGNEDQAADSNQTGDPGTG